jgi:hypothetical protein
MSNVTSNVEVTTIESKKPDRGALLQKCGDLAREDSVLYCLERDLIHPIHEVAALRR